MDNSIHQQPEYRAHRRATGAVAVDNTDLAVLLSEAGGARRAAHAKGFDSVDGYVELSAGTVDLQPLKLVRYRDGAGAPLQRFVDHGAVISGLVDGATFSVPGVHQGRIFIRVDATAAGADLVIYLAGGARSNESSI